MSPIVPQKRDSGRIPGNNAAAGYYSREKRSPRYTRSFEIIFGMLLGDHSKYLVGPTV